MKKRASKTPKLGKQYEPLFKNKSNLAVEGPHARCDREIEYLRAELAKASERIAEMVDPAISQRIAIAKAQREQPRSQPPAAAKPPVSEAAKAIARRISPRSMGLVGRPSVTREDLPTEEDAKELDKFFDGLAAEDRRAETVEREARRTGRTPEEIEAAMESAEAPGATKGA